MPNEKNLIPLTQRNDDDAQAIRSEGGRKSSEVRRRKKSMKQVMDMLLSMPANMQSDYQMLADMGIDINGLDTEEVNNMLVVNAALLRSAKNGDVASIKELRSIIQDDAYMKHRIKLEKEKFAFEKSGRKAEAVRSNNLFEAINESTQEDISFDDLPEIQQTAESDAYMVEQTEV